MHHHHHHHHHHHALRCGLLALWLSLATLSVWADDDCNAPVARWQTREAVRQMAVRQGWQIERLKIDDGCYEVRGTDAQGRSFKAKIDPETLVVVKMKLKDHQREREHRRDRAHEAPQVRPSPAVGTAPSLAPVPASSPGAAPRGPIE